MAFLHSFSFSFYINENVDTVNGLQHRINSSTQVFLQYICNWCEDATSCASLHWRLNRLQQFYTYVQRAAF